MKRRVDTYRKSALGKGGVSSDTVAQLGAARRALGDSFDEWRRELQSALPALASEDDPTSGYGGLLCEEDLEDPELPQDGPETQALGLPSDLEWGTGDCDPDSDLSRAALAELRLRTGHAHDLLASIRMSLRKKGALLEEKEKYAHGQKEHTRGQRKMKGVQEQAKFLADIYNRNLNRMKKLLIPSVHVDSAADIPPALRSIDKSKDLTIPPTRQLHNAGDTKRQLPWIFQPAGPQSLSAQAGEEWETECRRADWFRAWAAKKRTDEEVNLLYADGRAARRGFEFASRLWDGATEGDGDLALGARAYAIQKSHMFRQMATEVEKSVHAAHCRHVEMIGKLGEDEDEGLKKVYDASQYRQVPTDAKLDYTLVSATAGV
ncbi:hypothetical protein LXA43DRAFT_903425 [Ganoderma leucocontextum]|nr:hypothetical protein LXA43DRAFT_903425 [Ganoderma leucocontextum]